MTSTYTFFPSLPFNPPCIPFLLIISHFLAYCLLHLTSKKFFLLFQFCFLSFSVVNCVQFLPDGSCVASGSADRTIKMWDIRSRQLIQVRDGIYYFIFNFLYDGISYFIYYLLLQFIFKLFFISILQFLLTSLRAYLLPYVLTFFFPSFFYAHL
jgi:WD40 repeat protein